MVFWSENSFCVKFSTQHGFSKFYGLTKRFVKNEIRGSNQQWKVARHRNECLLCCKRQRKWKWPCPATCVDLLLFEWINRKQTEKSRKGMHLDRQGFIMIGTFFQGGKCTREPTVHVTVCDSRSVHKILTDWGSLQDFKQLLRSNLPLSDCGMLKKQLADITSRDSFLRQARLNLTRFTQRQKLFTAHCCIFKRTRIAETHSSFLGVT